MRIERNASAEHAEHCGRLLVRFAGATVQFSNFPANVQSAVLTVFI